jgi:hypothetical protein
MSKIFAVTIDETPRFFQFKHKAHLFAELAGLSESSVEEIETLDDHITSGDVRAYAVNIEFDGTVIEARVAQQAYSVAPSFYWNRQRLAGRVFAESREKAIIKVDDYRREMFRKWSKLPAAIPPEDSKENDE